MNVRLLLFQEQRKCTFSLDTELSQDKDPKADYIAAYNFYIFIVYIFYIIAESDQESIASASPAKSKFKKSSPLKMAVARTGRIKLSKPASDKTEAVDVHVKSLDDLNRAKLEEAKRILGTS